MSQCAFTLGTLAVLLAVLAVCVALAVPASSTLALPMPGGGWMPIPELLLLVAPLFALAGLALALRARRSCLLIGSTSPVVRQPRE